MVLVELASVEEAIDVVANLLAMLSQMKSKGSKPLKAEKAGAKQQTRRGTNGTLSQMQSKSKLLFATKDAQLQRPLYVDLSLIHI